MISQDDYARIGPCRPFLQQANSRLVREFGEAAILTHIPRGREVFAVGELTLKQFSLMNYLMSAPGQLYTLEDLLAEVWGIDFDTGANMVDVYVHFLRSSNRWD